MSLYFLGAFEEAMALGHHWCGEAHIFLELVRTQPVLDLTPEAAAAAVVADVERYGPEVTDDDEGSCLSAPSYHAIRGRVTGLALGLGGVQPGPPHVWAALSWYPDGITSRVLADLGHHREELLDFLGELGDLVPRAPQPNPLPAVAESERARRGHRGTLHEHLLLGLLAGKPDAKAGTILRIAGLTYAVLDEHLRDRIEQWDPPISRPESPVARPSPRAMEVFTAAEGVAATLSDGRVRSTDGLIAYLWQEDGQQVYPIEAQGSSAGVVIETLTAAGVDLPQTPVPEPDRTPWGQRIHVPRDRVSDVTAAVRERYPTTHLRPNCLGGEDWVIAQVHIDLQAIVDEVLAD